MAISNLTSGTINGGTSEGLTKFLTVIGCISVAVFTGWLAIQKEGIIETILLSISGGTIGFLIGVIHGYFKEKKYLKEYLDWRKEHFKEKE